MEKPVEIVEKCEFSTAIGMIPNSWLWEMGCISRCITGFRQKIFQIMLPREPFGYLPKMGEKVGKMEKHPCATMRILGDAKKSLCKIYKNTNGMNFHPREILNP